MRRRGIAVRLLMIFKKRTVAVAVASALSVLLGAANYFSIISINFSAPLLTFSFGLEEKDTRFVKINLDPRNLYNNLLFLISL